MTATIETAQTTEYARIALRVDQNGEPVKTIPAGELRQHIVANKCADIAASDVVWSHQVITACGETLRCAATKSRPFLNLQLCEGCAKPKA